MPFGLPIVRTRGLPAVNAALAWRETGDVPAAIVVLLVAVPGALLGALAAGHATGAAPDPDWALFAAAVLLLVPCALALAAALGELTRVHTLSIGDGWVKRRFCELGRCFDLAEPLRAYQGLQILDRSRRLFIRNQDRPLTGRRGPVTEFVIVLRHREKRACDVELFRAQPSLHTLLTMHRMQHATSGRASAVNADACAQLAAGYRHAVTRLCAQLDKPVLIMDAAGALHEWPAQTLDDWLQAPAS